MRVRLTFTLVALVVALLSAMAAGGAVAKEKLLPIDMSDAENCDFIAEPGSPLCMLPFPDDYYTVPDPTSPTGRRIDFTAQGMPTNVLGQPIDPTPYDASDGFSQGATILLKVPGIDTSPT
jgi:hypothetical protein